MSLKSYFNKAVATFNRFWEDVEIDALERERMTAEGGMSMVVTRGGPVFVKLAPEDAANIIKRCDQRLVEIRMNRAPSLTPKI